MKITKTKIVLESFVCSSPDPDKECGWIKIGIKAVNSERFWVGVFGMTGGFFEHIPFDDYAKARTYLNREYPGDVRFDRITQTIEKFEQET